jgi:hypothetical protein
VINCMSIFPNKDILTEDIGLWTSFLNRAFVSSLCNLFHQLT